MTQFVSDTVKSLRSEYPALSDYERFKIAIELERNMIFTNAFTAPSNNSQMPALEQIASALGFNPQYTSSISGAINNLSEVIEEAFGKRD